MLIKGSKEAQRDPKCAWISIERSSMCLNMARAALEISRMFLGFKDEGPRVSNGYIMIQKLSGKV